MKKIVKIMLQMMNGILLLQDPMNVKMALSAGQMEGRCQCRTYPSTASPADSSLCGGQVLSGTHS